MVHSTIWSLLHELPDHSEWVVSAAFTRIDTLAESVLGENIDAADLHIGLVM